MAGKPGSVCEYTALVALVAAFCLCIIRSSHATQHVVGEAAGWTLPSYGHVNYTKWAYNRTFLLGDTLLFTYKADLHNVLLVTRSDYRNCSSPNPLGTFDDGKTVIPLSSAGSKYFICGVPGHCGLGQKLSIMVRAADSLVPASSPSPSPSLSLGAPTHNPLKSPAPSPASSGTSSERESWMLVMGIFGVILETFWLL